MRKEIPTGRMFPLYYSEGLYFTIKGNPSKNIPLTLFWCSEIYRIEIDTSKSFEAHRSFYEDVLVQLADGNTIEVWSHQELLTSTSVDVTKGYNLNCNCHGFSLMDGRFWLVDPGLLLSEEYLPIVASEIKPNTDYIICFMKGTENIHSGKFRNGIVTHKRNVCLEEEQNLNEFNKKYPHYNALTKSYWIKKP